MKANKMITLDMELLDNLKKLNLNVSEYCNEKLWDYVTEMDNTRRDPLVLQEDLDKRLEEITKQKKSLEQRDVLKKRMQDAGITEEHIKFLKSMNTNILMAKDMKLGWFNKFGEEKNWSDLLALKEKWA